MTSRRDMETLFAKAEFADDVLTAARKHGLFGRKRGERTQKDANKTPTPPRKKKSPAADSGSAPQ